MSVRQSKWWVGLALVGAAAVSPAQNKGWTVYGGAEGSHYSDLKQINTKNASSLKQAWRFDTGDAGILQNTPLIAGRMLYGVTYSEKVIALDATNGKLLWTFDPRTLDPAFKGNQPVRGASYWIDGGKGRVLVGMMHFLYELDAETGKPVEAFGDHGRIDLRENLDTDPAKASVVITTPGAVYKDTIIVGFRAPETHPAPHGDIRAFDLKTGKLRWSFHTIPHPGEEGYESWPADAWKTAGAANAWSGITLDPAHGIVFAATGSAVDDFYGGDRTGNDLFANTLLALDANTGKKLWHFQGVHHDIWDRDFPAAPVLATVKHDGKTVDAVAQTTKQGYIYVFDRMTGKPLFPIEEMAVPQSDVPGEVSSPTQPHPLAPAPFTRQVLTEDDLTTRTPGAHAWALNEFHTFHVGTTQFTPFTLGKQTAVVPGFDGGAEWGGPAVDRKTGVLYVNGNNIVTTGGLVENKPAPGPGAAIYQSQCAVCHGSTRAGSPPMFPSLIGITDRLAPEQITGIVQGGNGRMPSFPNLSKDDIGHLIRFLGAGELPTETKELASEGVSQSPYRFTGYKWFRDPEGYPATATPWGTLSAVDLNTGKYLWQIPFGEYPELAAKGMATTGSESYGGPIATAGGVLFIAATIFDRQFHVFDSATGKLLWHTELPVAGLATPATYMVDGKQYIVIAAGGGKDPNHAMGGSYIAFSLP